MKIDWIHTAINGRVIQSYRIQEIMDGIENEPERERIRNRWGGLNVGTKQTKQITERGINRDAFPVLVHCGHPMQVQPI